MIRKPGNECTKKEFNTYKLEKVCMFSGGPAMIRVGIETAFIPKRIKYIGYVRLYTYIYENQKRKSDGARWKLDVIQLVLMFFCLPNLQTEDQLTFYKPRYVLAGCWKGILGNPEKVFFAPKATTVCDGGYTATNCTHSCSRVRIKHSRRTQTCSLNFVVFFSLELSRVCTGINYF